MTEAHSLLEKRNEEFELKMKEVMKLREVIKTAEQEKFQELDKVLCSITSSSHRVVSMDTRLRFHGHKASLPRHFSLTRGLFLESPETFGPEYFGYHNSLYIFARPRF